MNPTNANTRDFGTSNANYQGVREGFAGYASPTIYQHPHAMQASPPAYQPQSQVHLPPPAPYMPPPSPSLPLLFETPLRLQHSAACNTTTLFNPPQYTNTPLTTLLPPQNLQSARSSDDEVEVVDAPASTSSKPTTTKHSNNDASSRAPPPAPQPKHGGRSQGSKGFSENEDEQLVTCVEEIKPIGGNGWERVETKYNKWAEMNEYPDRTAQSLKKRFERINEKNIKAQSKPLGSGDRGELLTRALNADKDIDEKSGKDEIGLDTNYEDGDAGTDHDEANSKDAVKVKREVKEETDAGKEGKKKKGGLEDTVKVEKEYKAAKKGRDEKSGRRRYGAGVATEALVGLNDYVDFLQNENVRLQSEIQQLRDRIDTIRDAHFREVTQLNNTIIQERKRANRAEMELRLVQMQMQMQMGMGMGMGMMGMGGYPRFGGYPGFRGEVMVDNSRCRRSPSPLERYSSPAKRPRWAGRWGVSVETDVREEAARMQQAYSLLTPHTPLRRLAIRDQVAVESEDWLTLCRVSGYSLAVFERCSYLITNRAVSLRKAAVGTHIKPIWDMVLQISEDGASNT
ncbi:hypothetical protein NMY22_g6089 [Coprinellus aureogranulatus]|nr:hypothetical protein NMY22_g6089 [Coprinellus aureogranulatus]